MSTGQQREPSEEELRAAYDAEVKKLRVDHVVLETVVTLANLGMRRTGRIPGTEDERDVDQVRVAIESIRALMPVLEQISPEQVAPVRDALSQLQLAYVRIGGSEAGGTPTPPPDPGSPTAWRRRLARLRAREPARTARLRAEARGSRPGAALRSPVGPGPVAGLVARRTVHSPRSDPGPPLDPTSGGPVALFLGRTRVRPPMI